MTKPNLDEIIGDSKGKEAAKKIAEWMTKNCKYEFYSTPPRCGKSLRQEISKDIINCYDGNYNPKLENKKRKAIEKALKEIKNG